MKFSNPAVGLLLAVPSNIILILYENKKSYFDLSQTGLPKLKLHRPCSKFYFLQWYRICHKMNTCQIRSRGSCSLVFMKLMHKATIVLKTADLCSLSLPLLSYDDDFFFNGKNEHSLFINADCFVQLDERKKNLSSYSLQKKFWTFLRRITISLLTDVQCSYESQHEW